MISSPMVVGLGLTTLLTKGRSLSSRVLYMAAEVMAECCLTLSSVVASSSILFSLDCRYLLLSENLRSLVVSLMKSLGYPLFMNQVVSSSALVAKISGEDKCLSNLMNSPLTLPVLMLMWCAHEKCR